MLKGEELAALLTTALLVSRRIRGASCGGCFRICGGRKKNFDDRRSPQSSWTPPSTACSTNCFCSQVIGTVGSVTQRSVTGQTRGIGFALLLNEGMPGVAQDSGSPYRARFSLAPRIVDSPDPALPETMPAIPAPRGSGYPPCCAMRSPCFWRVWFSRLALLPRESSKGGLIGPC